MTIEDQLKLELVMARQALKSILWRCNSCLSITDAKSFRPIVIELMKSDAEEGLRLTNERG